jgi:hypothetical protein
MHLRVIIAATWRLTWRLTLGLTLGLAGCLSQPSTRAVIDSAEAHVALLAPRLVGDHSATQVVHGTFGSRDMSINCVVTIQNNQLTLVGLTALGVRAFTLKFDGQNLLVENSLPVPPQLTPERLLADVQLVFWPLDALREVYQQAGLELSQPFAGTRRVRRNDRVISEVHYSSVAASNSAVTPWISRSWLVNLQHDYTLSIDSKLHAGQLPNSSIGHSTAPTADPSVRSDQ